METVEGNGLHPAGSTPADITTAAFAYAARGWSVLPIEARGKRPLVAWLDLQQRIATAAEIRLWFRRWPDANVGIVTGRISQLVVVDVDAQHGGLESLAALQSRNGALPRTVESVTGGGGRHLYFAHPDGTLHSRVGICPGIDLRADGGCVVAPPSVHPSGRRYAWVPGRSPDELSLAPLPALVLDYMGDAVHSGHSQMHWRRIVHEGVVEGERNSTLASLTGHLLWRGVDPEVALELLLAWNRVRCRPPLPDDEVARVVQSITRLHLRESDAKES